MTDQTVYSSLLAGWTSAQLLQAGANQMQIDDANARILAFAQGAVNPVANGQGVQAGVQALQGLANGAVLNGIGKIKVVDYHQDTIQKYISWGVIAFILLGVFLYFVWPKGQQVGSAPAATSSLSQTVTFVIPPIPPIKFDPAGINVNVTGVQPGKR